VICLSKWGLAFWALLYFCEKRGIGERDLASGMLGISDAALSHRLNSVVVFGMGLTEAIGADSCGTFSRDMIGYDTRPWWFFGPSHFNNSTYIASCQFSDHGTQSSNVAEGG
jgi:hypothetical protein